MNEIQAIVMGVVQGLTEFLPISSSGHLVLFRGLLGVEPEIGIFFDVMLHMGTLISVIVVFNRDILEMFKEFFHMTRDIFLGRGPSTNKSPYRNMLVMVIITTIPTGVMGLMFKDVFETAFTSVMVVSIMLFITGVLLYLGSKIRIGSKAPQDITLLDALIIGVFQGLAITPGISRSGSTIFAGLTRGFSMELATKYSFIISLPAIAGAALVELKTYLDVPATTCSLTVTLAGMLAAAVSGTVAIKFLISVLNRGKLHYFSYYCWTIAVLGAMASLL